MAAGDFSVLVSDDLAVFTLPTVAVVVLARTADLTGEKKSLIRAKRGVMVVLVFNTLADNLLLECLRSGEAAAASTTTDDELTFASTTTADEETLGSALGTTTTGES